MTLNTFPKCLRNSSHLAERLLEFDPKYGLDDDCMSTDVPDDDYCVSVCSDDSNVSRVHYQDAVEQWWKQSGRGVKHSDFNDIPPRVVNDDDSLDDECLS